MGGTTSSLVIKQAQNWEVETAQWIFFTKENVNKKNRGSNSLNGPFIMKTTMPCFAASVGNFKIIVNQRQRSSDE